MNYSIDMVRLKVDIPVKVLDTLVLKPFESEPGISYRMMTTISSYRHNFYVDDYNMWGERCKFWIGCIHNAKKKSDVVDVVIEYNPNKCVGSVLLDYVMSNIYSDNQYVEIKSFDLAIDIPVNILDLSFSSSGNMSRRIFDNGSDDKTFYFRKGKSNGALKVYNKKREAGLNYELTRYEITLTPNVYIDKMFSYSVPSDLFVPVRCISNFQMPIDIKGTDKVLLLACMEHMEYLKELDSRKRKKIEQLLADNCSIDFDYGSINKVVCDFFKSIYTL